MTLKLKTNRNYSVYERGCSFLNAPLFTLKFDSFFQFQTVRGNGATQLNSNQNSKKLNFDFNSYTKRIVF